MFIKQALQGIGYGIIGALIVQISINAIHKHQQKQALSKPIMLNDREDILLPIKQSDESEPKRKLKPYIVSPLPCDSNETEAKK